jgi:Fe2+ transport system protein FeoA
MPPKNNIPTQNCIPLTTAKTGQMLELVKITAGKNATHQLLEMGLIPGTPLQILQDSGGPLLLVVRESRLALGRGLASKLLVTPRAL